MLVLQMHVTKLQTLKNMGHIFFSTYTEFKNGKIDPNRTVWDSKNYNPSTK